MTGPKQLWNKPASQARCRKDPDICTPTAKGPLPPNSPDDAPFTGLGGRPTGIYGEGYDRGLTPSICHYMK